MKITILMEDTLADDRLACEAGLSILIETPDKTLLLDTGRTGKFVENARALDVDLDRVDAAIVSHAHYDHSGGLDRFFAVNRKTSVYMHKTATKNYYGNIGSKLPLPVLFFVHPFVKYSMRLSRKIGLDPAVLKQHRSRFTLIDKTVSLSDDIFIITPIQKKHPVPIGNKFLLAEDNGRLYPDDFIHEILLVIRENHGLVLFSGCCHSGIMNMIDTVKHLFPDEKIQAVVGGFHLVLQPGKDRMAGTKKQVEAIADFFDKEGVEQVYSGHCTGRQAFDVLKGKLGDRINYMGCGKSFTI